MKNYLVTYEWCGKKFTSQHRIHQLARVGLINLEKTYRNQYGDDFTYRTLDGQFIASYYKDNTFGHGSQATGIELKDAIPVIDELPDTIEATREGNIRFKDITMYTN